MEGGLFIMSGSGQYRPATHEEIINFAGKIQQDIALESPGTWPGREGYVEMLRPVLSDHDNWLFDAGLLIQCSTAEEERAEMLKLITAGWFEGLKGLRRANPPATVRLAEINGVWRRHVDLCSTSTEWQAVANPSEKEAAFVGQIQSLMPHAVCEVLDMVYVLKRGDQKLPITSVQRVVRVTATKGLVSTHRALTVPE